LYQIKITKLLLFNNNNNNNNNNHPWFRWPENLFFQTNEFERSIHDSSKILKGPFGSRIRRGREGRGGILTEGMRDILIKNVFGLQGEGKGGDFKIILPFYP